VGRETEVLAPDRNPKQVGKPFISHDEYKVKVSQMWDEYVEKAAVVEIET
jgi:hypothetical protein